MGYFALVKDNVVSSVIVAEQSFVDAVSLEVLGADLVVEVFEDRPSPGFTYDANTQTFSPPVE